MVASAAAGQELTASAGLVRSDEAGARTHGWLLSYRHERDARFAASLSYQNEGHVPSHHRDGFAAQLWARTLLSPRLSLAAGAGPYRYFDTVSSSDDPRGYSDRHGWGMVYSLAATWRAGSSAWLYQLRADRIVLAHGIDTSRLTAGVGYRLQPDLRRAGESARNTEVALYLGKTIVNSLESQTATAHSAELRHAFGRLLRGSIAWLDENDAQLVKRQGLVVQAWLEPSFQRERMSLGIGYGPYIASDDQRRDRNGLFGSGLLTLTASLRLKQCWLARLSWNRVISRYDRDTDVLLLGVGYRF
jgi:hypothetical protein